MRVHLCQLCEAHVRDGVVLLLTFSFVIVHSFFSVTAVSVDYVTVLIYCGVKLHKYAEKAVRIDTLFDASLKWQSRVNTTVTLCRSFFDLPTRLLSFYSPREIYSTEFMKRKQINI